MLLRGRRVRQFSINEFLNWHENGELILVPWFQRRTVWNEKARSYLIDTIVRNLPIPIIIMRESIDPISGRTIREVVDGQQRLRAIFDFYNGSLTIRRLHNVELSGIQFGDLPEIIKSNYREYELSVNVLLGVSDAEVLDIFGRLNSYTQVLNRQEKLNAKYHGDFKSYVYHTSSQYVDFFLENKILSKRAVLRMHEAEFISELTIAMMAGLQDKKNSIENFYRNYDDNFPLSTNLSDQFHVVITCIQEILGDDVASTNFRRRMLFYSLFCVIFDLLYGLPEQTPPQAIEIPTTSYSSIHENLLEVSEQLDLDTPDSSYSSFIEACSRQTDNIRPRQQRHDTIKEIVLQAMMT